MRQLELGLQTWGGARRGAGRKGAGRRHGARVPFFRWTPVHATMRAEVLLRDPLWLAAFEAVVRELRVEGFHVLHYALLSNHLHLLVEAASSAALSAGMRVLLGRLSRTYNRVFARRGAVFSERYHVHLLRSPRETRNALRYVIDNHALHRERAGHDAEHFRDPFSSAHLLGAAEPRTWLVRRALRS